MRAAVVPIRDLGPGEIAAWSALAGRAVQPNPLFEPTCLVPAARHLANGDDMVVAVAEEGGRWYGCVPLCPAPMWRALRRPVLVTQLRRMTYDATPLVDRERPEEAAACLVEGLRGAARGGTPGLVVLDWLDEGPAAAAFREACHRAGAVHRVYQSWERPMLHRRDGEDHRDRHSGKFLYNVRRMRRRLAQAEGGAVAMVDRSAGRDGPEVVMAMEERGYKGRSGLAVLGHPGEPEWFRAMCDGFRDDGRLHVQTLEVGDRPVAAQLLLQAQDGLFLLKTTFDEAYAGYSPGVQLHLDAVDHLQATTDAAWIDTCTYPGNETLLRLYPDRRGVCSVVMATGGMVERSALRAVWSAREALWRGRRARSR
ncbi:MAG: GNAT family N-acetyltransferase, partial [Acidimicrobiales bacterium]